MRHYDLALTHSPTINATAAEAQRFGYELIAVDHRSATLPKTDKDIIIDELPDIPFKVPPFFSSPGHIPPFPPPTSAYKLNRFTFTPATETSFSLGPSTSPVFKYDIIAVEPGNQKCFEYCCLTVKGISIVTLPEKASFKLVPKTIKGAIKRGVFIEIKYSNAFKNNASRREFAMNLRTLIRVTKGIGVLVSSGASDRLDVRRPLEVLNMLKTVGGATVEQARRMLNNGELLLSCSAALKAMDGIALLDPAGPEYSDEDEPLAKRWGRRGLSDYVAF